MLRPSSTRLLPAPKPRTGCSSRTTRVAVGCQAHVLGVELLRRDWLRATSAPGKAACELMKPTGDMRRSAGECVSQSPSSHVMYKHPDDYIKLCPPTEKLNLVVDPQSKTNALPAKHLEADPRIAPASHRHASCRRQRRRARRPPTRLVRTELGFGQSGSAHTVATDRTRRARCCSCVWACGTGCAMSHAGAPHLSRDA